MFVAPLRPCRGSSPDRTSRPGRLFFFAILDVGDLDFLRDARLACNLPDEVVHLLFESPWQSVVILLQDGLAARAGPEMTPWLPVFCCLRSMTCRPFSSAWMLPVDGRVVAETLRCVAPHQKDVAGNILVPVFREVERGDGPDLQLREVDVLPVGRQHAELAALDPPVVVQTLLAGRA